MCRLFLSRPPPSKPTTPTYSLSRAFLSRYFAPSHLSPAHPHLFPHSHPPNIPTPASAPIPALSPNSFVPSSLLAFYFLNRFICLATGRLGLVKSRPQYGQPIRGVCVCVRTAEHRDIFCHRSGFLFLSTFPAPALCPIDVHCTSFPPHFATTAPQHQGTRTSAFFPFPL